MTKQERKMLSLSAGAGFLTLLGLELFIIPIGFVRNIFDIPVWASLQLADFLGLLDHGSIGHRVVLFGKKFPNAPSFVFQTCLRLGATVGRLPFMLASLFFYWLLLKRAGIDMECQCRNCRHILRGLSEPICPECGERI